MATTVASPRNVTTTTRACRHRWAYSFSSRIDYSEFSFSPVHGGPGSKSVAPTARRWFDLARDGRFHGDRAGPSRPTVVIPGRCCAGRALKGAGISTRRGFAGLAELPRLDRVARTSCRSARGRPGCRWPARTTGYPVRAPGSRTRWGRRPGRQPGAARAARTGRRGPVLRYRGGPVLLGGRAGVRAAVPVRRRRYGRGGRRGTPPVHADLGLRPGGRETRVRGADRLHH